jgi:hypothetical protein
VDDRNYADIRKPRVIFTMAADCDNKTFFLEKYRHGMLKLLGMKDEVKKNK